MHCRITGWTYLQMWIYTNTHFSLNIAYVSFEYNIGSFSAKLILIIIKSSIWARTSQCDMLLLFFIFILMTQTMRCVQFTHKHTHTHFQWWHTKNSLNHIVIKHTWKRKEKNLYSSRNVLRSNDFSNGTWHLIWVTVTFWYNVCMLLQALIERKTNIVIYIILDVANAKLKIYCYIPIYAKIGCHRFYWTLTETLVCPSAGSIHRTG